MSLPIPANTTCDIYNSGNVPPAAPDVAGVPCYLEEKFRNIKPATTPALVYSHILRVAKDVDVRDPYNSGSGGSLIYIPNKNGTKFVVAAVARAARGSALDHKVVYLLRSPVTWPSNEV